MIELTESQKTVRNMEVARLAREIIHNFSDSFITQDLVFCTDFDSLFKTTSYEEREKMNEILLSYEGKQFSNVAKQMAEDIADVLFDFRLM